MLTLLEYENLVYSLQAQFEEPNLPALILEIEALLPTL